MGGDSGRAHSNSTDYDGTNPNGTQSNETDSGMSGTNGTGSNNKDGAKGNFQGTSVKRTNSASAHLGLTVVLDPGHQGPFSPNFLKDSYEGFKVPSKFVSWWGGS